MNSEHRGGDHSEEKKDWEREQYFLARRAWNITYPINAGLLIIAALTGAAITWQSIYAGRTLTETRNEFKTAERPYVSLGRKDGTIAEFAAPKDLTANQPVGLKLYFQNGGRSPALSVNVGLIFSPMSIVGAGASPFNKQPFQPLIQGFHRLQRTTDEHGGVSSVGGGISISPQSEYVKLLPEQFSQEEWQRALKGEIAPIIFGMFEYCDEFGNYTCREFSLFWQGPPENVFMETTELDCANFYSFPPAQPGQTYLPPCEQPDEREQREQRERDQILQAAAKAGTVTPTPSPTP